METKELLQIWRKVEMAALKAIKQHPKWTWDDFYSAKTEFKEIRKDIEAGEIAEMEDLFFQIPSGIIISAEDLVEPK